MFKSIVSKLFPTSTSQTAMPSGTISSIIVPKSAVAALHQSPEHLVQAVVDYVNFMMSQGKFTRDEIPSTATQAYHCDYYLAQVNNGGHAQFVGNSRGILQFVLNDIDQGLSACGATEHHALFAKMAAWIAANPNGVAKQTGFTGGIAPELAAQDDPLFSLEKKSPLTPLLARWIAASPQLQVVDDANIQSVMAEVAKMNPHLEKRMITATIAQIDHWLSDPLHLGIGMTGGRCAQVEPIVGIGGGSHMDTPEGKQTVWLVKTVQGNRFGIVNDQGAALLEYIAGSDLTQPTDLANITLEDMENFVPPKVGAYLAKVPLAEIQSAGTLCQNINAAGAVDLLLRKLGTPSVADFVSVRSAGPDDKGKIGASLFIVADRMTRAFSVIVSDGGAMLLAEPSHERIAAATAAEISDHVATHRSA